MDGILIINARKNNVFFTLTDSNYKVLTSLSGGYGRILFKEKGFAKREKISFDVFISLAKLIYEKCTKMQISTIFIRTKVSLKKMYLIFLNELVDLGLNISGVYFYLCVPHSLGPRRKKLKRN